MQEGKVRFFFTQRVRFWRPYRARCNKITPPG
jgi:hypothetical protein